MAEGTAFCQQCGKKTEAPQVTHSYSAPPPPPPLRPAAGAPIAENFLRPMDYVKMLLISAIPNVGFIIMLIWAFSDSVPLAKKNFARGILLFGLILAGIVIVLFFIFGAAIMKIMEEMPDYSFYYWY